MIGNPKWFNVRKYTGWGLTPNCWQGWAYVFVFALPIILINEVPLNISSNYKNIFSLIWILLLLVDVIHMMSQVKKDERERLHEALADRNALWFMMFVLVASALYDSFFNQSTNLVFLIAVLGSVIVKSITQLYLRDK